MTEAQRRLQQQPKTELTLFFSRCSDLKIGERASSSLAPPYAPSFLGQRAASSQVAATGPQGLPGRTKVTLGRCSGHQRSSFFLSRISAFLLFPPTLQHSSQPQCCFLSKHPSWFHPICVPLALWPWQPSSEMSPPRTSGGSPVTLVLSGEKGRNSPQLSLQDAALAVEDTGREQARSRSPLRGRNAQSSFVDTTDCDRSTGRRTGPPRCGRAPRDGAASGPSNRSFQGAAAPRAAQEQTQLRQREMSRSVRQDCDRRSRFVRHRDRDPSSGNRKRQRTSSPCCDRSPRAVPGPSNTSLKQAPVLRAVREQSRPREQRRFPRRGCDDRSQFVQCTDHQPSPSKRKRGRTSPAHCDKAPVEKAVPGPSNTSFRQRPMLRAGWEQTQPGRTECRRSSEQGYNLRRRFVQCADPHPSRRKRRVSMPQRCMSCEC